MKFKAGDDLNRTIAELLGFRVEKRKHTIALIRPDGSERINFGSEDAAWWNVPQYSTDLNLAFALPVDSDHFLDLHGPCANDDWYAFVSERFSDSRYESEGYEPPYRAWAETGALALCLVWLMYYGVKHSIPGLQPEIYEFLKTTEKPDVDLETDY